MARSRKWMINLGILLVLVLVSGSATAVEETCCRLHGRIISAKDGTPLQGATVQLENLDTAKTHLTQSDEWGEYSFRDLPYGDYRVKVSRKGYVTLTSTVHLRREHEVHLNFLLRSPEWTL